MKLVYLMGEPASGKTSVMREIVSGLQFEVVNKPFTHTIYENGFIQLGKDRNPFGGTDTLPMNVQPKVISWLSSTSYPVVLGEGDRLTNSKFFDAVLRSEYDLALWYIATPQWVSKQRRMKRNTKQNETWAKGRRSKVIGLINYVSPKRILNGTDASYDMASKVWSFDLVNC